MSAMAWTPPDHAALMDALDATWPAAEVEALGAWRVRRGLGGGRRASSVLPAGDPGMTLPAAVDAVEARMRAWGQPPLFQLGPEGREAALEAELVGRGYALATPCLVLAAEAAAVAARGTGKRMVIAVRAPLAALDRMWAEERIGPARRAVMARAAPPKEILMLRSDDDRAAAACFVAAHFPATGGAVAVMSALHVARAHRRAGLGSDAVAAAARWAVEAGAATLALSVEESNLPARALYDRLGFVVATAYRYREAVGADGPSPG